MYHILGDCHKIIPTWLQIVSLFHLVKPDKFWTSSVNDFMVFALMNGCASCFLVCKQLWFKSRGGRGAQDNMWSLTCSLALYPYCYIFPSRGVMRDSPHDHETHLQPQLHQLPPTPSSSSLLVHLCRLTPWLRLPLKTPVSSGRVVTCWWRFGCENSGATAGRGQWVWGTTRKGTWSVGVGTSCKRDVLTATTLS